ncbi:MAG: hypothetical protein QXI09_02125 [Candidatus Aenigmatarchaeota archaeon]
MDLQASYEFYIVFFVFLIIISYIISYILSFRNIYLKEIKKEILFGEAYKISQILVNDVGEPENWHLNIDNAKRIGLLSSSNYFNHLSLSKINVFNLNCRNNYNLIKNLIGTELDFSIRLVSNDGNVLIDCIRPFGEEVIEIDRIVSFDDGKGYGVMKIWVY